jgi:methylglyoxal synthase
MNIALIAHDHKKDDMVQLAQDFAEFLSRCHLVATGTTGGRLHVEAGLQVECMLSGPMGGDLQIGARLATGGIDAVIFLRDPMTPQPHEPDINALVRACDVHNIPCATNLAGGRLLLSELSRRESTPPKILESAPAAPGDVCAVPVSAPRDRD